ncbi:hypothetical protein OG213_02550 [Streptomyces mirabilis]
MRAECEPGGWRLHADAVLAEFRGDLRAQRLDQGEADSRIGRGGLGFYGETGVHSHFGPLLLANPERDVIGSSIDTGSMTPKRRCAANAVTVVCEHRP